MQKRLLIYLSSIAAVLLIAFGVYWLVSPKIITKPALDEHYNAVVFQEGHAFPYRPQVRFNLLPVTWHIEGTLMNNTTAGDIGVSINPETGEITWQDKREGPFRITITASNRMGKDRQSFTARQIIKPLFEITFPPEIPAYREFRGIVKTRGSLPMQYTCTNDGITFDSRGVIWQKPEPGTYTVTFIASNQAGKCQRDWNVVVKAEPVRIISEPVAVVTEGDDYVYPVMASGTPKFTWELPECPKGMIIGKEGVVFLPSRYVKKGEYNVTIRVSNVANGQKYSDTQHYTLRCVEREKKEEEQPQEEKKKAEKKEKKKQESAKAQVVPDVNVIVKKRKKDEVKEPVPEKEAPQKPEEQPAPPTPQPQVSQEEERKEQERMREEEQKRLLEAQKKLEEERLRQEELQKVQEEMQRLEAQKRAEEEKQRLEAQRKAEEEAQRRQEEEQKRQEEQRQAEESKRLEEEQKKVAEEKRKEQMMKALEEKQLQEERKKAEEEKQRLEEQKKAVEVKRQQEDQKRLEQQKKAEEDAARLREERKKAEDEKRRREEQRKAKEEKAQAEKQAEEKQVAVPTKKEIVREKTEKGKKVKLTYDFVLEGWDFNDFYELSRASGFKILFISPFKGVEEKNYEVTGIDHQRHLAVQMQPLDENNYSKKGCMVVDIPAEGRDHWTDYETHLREQLKKGSHSLVVFFPYSFMASLEDASKSYYGAHCADQKLPFEQGAGTVKFKITGDRFIKIVSMGNMK